MRLSLHILYLFLLCFFLSSCASTRSSIPEGHVPTQEQVAQADEQYGHQVFQALAQKYTLDRDDDRILRVRGIVDKLTQVKDNNQNIWHVYLFEDDNFKNAAATRGNFIFVWSGIVNSVQSDDELATILAHEIGHVVAGHTQPDPAEEVNKMLAGITGRTARQVMTRVGDPLVAALASIGGMLASELVKAIIVNPNQRDLEHEADQIGLFIMAEAGYDPQKAITFWERVQNDPSFSGAPVEFLSTHPSSEDRLDALRKSLPKAIARYNGESTDSFIMAEEQQKGEEREDIIDGRSSYRKERTLYWEVMDNDSPVYEDANTKSDLLGKLKSTERVAVVRREGNWLRISSPYEGFVQSFHLSPVE